MSNLSDEMNVSPRQRITVPENHTAIIVNNAVLQELKAMCFIIRGPRRYSPENKNAMQSIAGDLLLAIVEAEHGKA